MSEPARILIVDDEPDILEALAELLGSLGYEVARAGGATEALALAEAAPPDVVITDVVMPGMDGVGLCRALKAREATRLVPVLIMTALGGLEDRIRGLEAGADDYLTKPVDLRELTARVQTALRFKQAVDGKLGELGRIRDHLAKFVPQAVRRLVAANPDAPALDKRERDVTVLFLDVSGYVRLSERLDANTVNALIERYFSRFLDVVSAAGGDITDTAGDGFMAVFLDDDPGAHAARAADAALALLEATAALNATGEGPALSVHMGINSGPAWVGSTRFEGARAALWTFTASGLVTSVAARLAAAAGAGEIFAGPETVRRLGRAYRVERVERAELKNVSADLVLHRVLGRAGAAPGARA